jgi:hypothetical protein
MGAKSLAQSTRDWLLLPGETGITLIFFEQAVARLQELISKPLPV